MSGELKAGPTRALSCVMARAGEKTPLDILVNVSLRMLPLPTCTSLARYSSIAVAPPFMTSEVASGAGTRVKRLITKTRRVDNLQGRNAHGARHMQPIIKHSHVNATHLAPPLPGTVLTPTVRAESINVGNGCYLMADVTIETGEVRFFPCGNRM